MKLHIEKRDGTAGGIKGGNGQWLCRKSDTLVEVALPDLGQDELS